MTCVGEGRVYQCVDSTPTKLDTAWVCAELRQPVSPAQLEGFGP